MKIACVVGILLLAALSTVSQDRHVPVRTSRNHRVAWQLFAPRGLGFSITVPAKPRRFRDWIGDEDPEGYKSIDTFGTLGRHSHLGFAIIALLPTEAMLKAAGGRNDLKGLEMLIGGDDAEPASQLPIKVNGLTGTEFIYHFPKSEEARHRRGRVINGGRRIFVLIYVANTAANLNSAAAIRFFNSFKVAKAHRVGSRDYSRVGR